MFVFYFLAVFISLFILYAVSRHDFVLLRQSISLRHVYDNVFISLFFFYIISRIFYAFYIGAIEILHPLKFFYIAKYPGIFPYAGFAGILICTLFLFRKKKNKFRILDILFLSFSPIIILDILLKSNSSLLLPIKIVSLLVLLLFYGWFIKIHNKFTTKDGFITCMTSITYSLVSLAFSVAQYGIFSIKFLWLNILFILIILISSFFLLLVQRDTFNKQ